MTASFENQGPGGQGPEICPKCGGRLLGEVLTGRQVNGSTRNNRIVGLSCGCGYWRDVEVPTTTREITVEEVKPNRLQQFLGGRKSGVDISPASVVAVKYFDLISQRRLSGIGWEPISKEMVKLSKEQFCWRSLKRYFDQELARRFTDPAKWRAQQMAGRASAAKRNLRRKEVSA